jgi:DNA-binding LacI/PurR family transcriptional regulator
MPPTTLAELAEQLNLSTATISRALNDQPGVGAETRQRVLSAAAELGFVPHSGARTLVTTRTGNIGFVLYAKLIVSDPFYSRIVQGVERECARRGYHLFLSALEPEQTAQPHAFSLVQSRRVDGLILAGPDIPARFVLELHATGLPIVLVDNALSETAVDTILGDDSSGAYAATRHLVEHGYRTIAGVSGPRGWVSSRERIAGYRRALEEAGLMPQVVAMDETTHESGRDAMQQILDGGSAPRAIFAVNDAMALGVIHAVEAAGLRVPEDVAVVGFDDLTWTALHRPALTTVHIYKEQMGRLAAARLLDLIAEPSSQPVRALVNTRLVIRQSCGCAPAPS